MKSIPFRLALILVLVAACAWAVSAKPVRLGKDLRGGVSLVYSLSIPEGASAEQTLAQVIEVLKQRVNPQGVLDISMQPQGRDRIEIVMPLPNPEVRELQRTYDETLASTLAASRVGATELDQALAAGQAVSRFGGLGGLSSEVAVVQQAFDEARDAKSELERAVSAAAGAEAISAAEDRVVAADLALERLRAGLLARNLPESRLAAALSMDARAPQAEPTAGEASAPAPVSPRQVELDSITAEFPHLSDRIGPLVAAYDAYLAKRTGFDDPEDLMRLLRGAGVLEFHIAVAAGSPEGVNVEDLRTQLAEAGPRGTDSPVARWYRINALDQWADTPEQLDALEADPATYLASTRGLVGAKFAGDIYVLLYISESKCMTHAGGDRWAIEQAFQTQDQRLGGAAVAFNLDATGGARMARLTTPNVGKPMAIVLDEQVYSAPSLNSAIAGSGVISGNFTPEQINYLIRVLAAGSLEARLSSDPVSVNILGPSIGIDNLVRGREAIVLSVAITCVVMVVYYFLAGLVAVIALAINALMIFGIMAMIDGTFTLPGLAGIALSIAMAVDANVLIYERVREEREKGEDLPAAIRNAYARALSAIIDGNVTNLIVVAVLYKVGATEVKGFALTMLIGVITTLFTALFVTRTLFMVLQGWFGLRSMPMLPTVVPAISRLLMPKVDWVGLRPVFLGVSAVLAVISLGLVASRGGDMLETEFRGGVSLGLTTRPATAGEAADAASGRLVLSRPEVERRVRAIGDAAGEGNPILWELRNANVLTVGDAGAEADSPSFQIRVGNPAGGEFDESRVTRDIVEAVVREFAPQLDVQLPLEFDGAGDAAHASRTFQLEREAVGEAVGRPDVREPIGDFRGGVAVVVSGISPPATLDDLSSRIARMRLQPDFAGNAGRPAKVVGLRPADPSDLAKGYVDVAVLVSDPAINSRTADLATWDSRLAASEWRLVSEALSQQASLDSVSSFSPIVAQNLAANANVAVVLSMIFMLAYIWIRFGSLRYSTATVIGLAWNVCITLGFLAIAPALARSGAGPSLYVEEFRIDLNVIAALLTIVGYSLNDTIVIMDRIRENRGKLPYATREGVNLAINQTFSRTVLTGGSTLATAVILIVLGGTGIRPFAYTFLIGLIAGTISSVIISGPLVYSRKLEEDEKRKAAEEIASRRELVQPRPA
jgi:SecD/SecF fusion protein